ncbi:SDR family NAD(P)-dependent oxidoreductase [Glaciecola sp. 1036]|uniref:SDR family NAD(P)-dependent oxidoreductase n=1 Tax=Alteromonadaceae TaxID=72275 RepID=UPI003D06EE38
MRRAVIVTGGSSGIGLAICSLFERSGYKVFNLDCNQGEIGQWIDCDVTDHIQVRKEIEAIYQDTVVDTLVCNAGKHYSASIENTSEQDLVDLFNLNVKGAFSATQSVLPYMKNANFGRVIYIASEQALVGKPNSFAYNLTKHALASMAKTTALDYASFGITANAICPGTIDTPLYQNAINNYCQRSGADPEKIHAEEAQCQPVGRIGQPEEVAEYALFLASEKSGFITGSLQVLDGGYTAR